jgi:hypothetical protein
MSRIIRVKRGRVAMGQQGNNAGPNFSAHFEV